MKSRLLRKTELSGNHYPGCVAFKLPATEDIEILSGKRTVEMVKMHDMIRSNIVTNDTFHGML